MWLDRLSGLSTPSPAPPSTSRAYSPAPPQRPSHLVPTSAPQRPIFSPRSSSLSVHSNDSTTSLLASSKRINGSSLKQSVTATDAPDPLKVLERLLGGDANGQVSGSQVEGKETTELELEGELDFGGLSLREILASGETTDAQMCAA